MQTTVIEAQVHFLKSVHSAFATIILGLAAETNHVSNRRSCILKHSKADFKILASRMASLGRINTFIVTDNGSGKFGHPLHPAMHKRLVYCKNLLGSPPCILRPLQFRETIG